MTAATATVQRTTTHMPRVHVAAASQPHKTEGKNTRKKNQKKKLETEKSPPSIYRQHQITAKGLLPQRANNTNNMRTSA